MKLIEIKYVYEKGVNAENKFLHILMKVMFKLSLSSDDYFCGARPASMCFDANLFQWI